MMSGGKQARWKTKTSLLAEAAAITHTGVVNVFNLNDNNDSTFASYVSASGAIDEVTATLSFPGIPDAQEILAVRFRVKGQGGTGAGISCGVELMSAVDASALPSGTFVIASFPTGGALTTLDTGLTTSAYSQFDSNLFSAIDVPNLVGSSATVINWWKGGPRALVTFTDRTGSFTSGNIYTVSMQIRYRAKS